MQVEEQTNISEEVQAPNEPVVEESGGGETPNEGTEEQATKKRKLENGSAETSPITQNPDEQQQQQGVEQSQAVEEKESKGPEVPIPDTQSPGEMTDEDIEGMVNYLASNKETLVKFTMDLAKEHRDSKVVHEAWESSSTDPARCKIFVRSLNFSTTDDKLKQVFSQYGDVKEAIVIKEKGGSQKSKGFGFVTFGHVKQAQLALKTCKHRIDERDTYCNVANQKQEGTRFNQQNVDYGYQYGGHAGYGSGYGRGYGAGYGGGYNGGYNGGY